MISGENPKGILSRADKALSVKEQWRDLLEDAYEYFCPQRESWNFDSKGERKTTKVYDSIGEIAINEFANRMMAAITPQDTVWVELELGINHEKSVRENVEIKRQLALINEKIFGYINTSNFYTVIGEGYLDLAIGTVGITVEEDGTNIENPLVFGLLQQHEVGYEAGPHGLVENVYRKVSRKLRNLDRLYPGGNFSSLQEKIGENKDDSVDIYECMMYDARKKEYWITCLYGDNVIWDIPRGDVSPWIVGRWMVKSNEVRGRGPALSALPDVKSLNKVQQFALQKAALDLAGLWTGQDDGIFNPYTTTIAPGTVIPVSSNLTSNPTLTRLDTSAPLQLTQFEIQKMQTNIRTHLYNDTVDPNGAVRSATEVSLRQAELAQRIGANFGRIQNELLMRVLNSIASVLKRRGLIPPMLIDGKDVAVKFTSPLARAQDREDLQELLMMTIIWGKGLHL